MLRRQCLHIATLALLALGLSACPEVDFEGVSCPCPNEGTEYLCVEGICKRPCNENAPCSDSSQTCVSGICVADVIVPDPQCISCTQSPASECLGNDDTFRSWVNQGSCGAGLCQFVASDTACTNCSQQCLGGCATLNLGTPSDCEVSRFCAIENGQAVVRAVNQPNDTSCTLSNNMTGSCLNGECKGCTKDADCIDENNQTGCMKQACDLSTGQCQQTVDSAQNGMSCDDSDMCTHTDLCNAGQCAGTTITCTDDSCATRTCNGTSTCTESPINNGNSCDGDNSCKNYTCSDGSCSEASDKADGTAWGESSEVCCGGEMANIASDADHCGGCGMACGMDQSCESASATPLCGANNSEENFSGRCTCVAGGIPSGQLCPEGQNGLKQTCRTVTPYSGVCAPLNVNYCAEGATFLDLESCPNICHY